MNIDKEIEDLVQSERRLFEERRKEASLSLKEKESRKEKGKIANERIIQEDLKEKWKKERKEIKIACHNINGLKTKG